MKRSLSFLFALLLAGSAQAQFGIKAGLNMAVLDGSNINADTKYKTQYHAGAFYEYKIAGPLSLQPELLYSVQGTERKSDVEDYDTKLQYLNLPILVKLTAGPVFVEAGPQFGLLMTAKEAGTLLLTPPTPTSPAQYGKVSKQVDDQYKKGDFSLCAGLGVKVSSLLIGARFNAGLNDINDAKSVAGVNDPKLKNRVFQAYLGYQIGGHN
ncbi:porin family protein [Hymenobacter sp. BT491]|uniref:porin family protein n=1 Tax=Hymenobacter sp. BT491 TaxID=2766779 RepID=UPI001653CB57|nr:porin family protein [Hymenobacter sp. BT491]MBC6991552.1 PorT family protein [Hymenobacter sp. BT491]